MENSIVFFYIGIFIAAALVVTWISLWKRTEENRQKKLQALNHAPYFTVVAGTKYEDVPCETVSVSKNLNAFRNASGKRLNPEDYLLYVVKGNSMQLYGIHDGNLIFVRKLTDKDNLRGYLPKAIVLKRRGVKSGECDYKLRRAWRVCSYKECVEAAKELVNSKEFEIIRNKPCFTSEEKMISELADERLEEFRKKYGEESPLILSTTYLTDEKRVRFSVHRPDDLVGIVEACFAV